MKIIPYIRFAVAVAIIFNWLSHTSFTFVHLTRPQIVAELASALFSLTFALYCSLMGLQELKERQLFNARFFNAFGVFFQIIIFVVGLFFLRFLFGLKIEVWKIGWLIIYQMALLVLIFVDVRRIWAKEE